jgi:hypothetical protein
MNRSFKTVEESIAYDMGRMDGTKAEIERRMRADVPPPAESLRDIKIDGLGAVITQDPWKHRTEGMRCKTCMWFLPKLPNSITTHPDQWDLGRCRRHAPTHAGYPVVFVNDWCGDHRIDENKV